MPRKIRCKLRKMTMFKKKNIESKMPAERGGRTHLDTLKAAWLYGHQGCTDTGRFLLSIQMWPFLQVSSGY